MKQKISDFIYALVITMGILICFALVSGTEVFDDALRYDENEKVFDVFGTSMMINEKAVSAMGKVYRFNDCLFGNGFSKCLKYVAKESAEFVADGIGIAFGVAKKIVGAE